MAAEALVGRAAVGSGRWPPAAVRAGAHRKVGWVSWRTVSTFVAGVLATLATALLLWCRGPARADLAVTDRMVRRWAAVWLRAAGARVLACGLEQVRQ